MIFKIDGPSLRLSPRSRIRGARETESALTDHVRVTHRMSQPETTDDARLEMMREQQTLRQLKRQPLVPLAGAAEEPF